MIRHAQHRVTGAGHRDVGGVPAGVAVFHKYGLLGGALGGDEGAELDLHPVAVDGFVGGGVCPALVDGVEESGSGSA